MQRALICLSTLLFAYAAVGASSAKSPPKIPTYISAALADPSRPADDVKLDDARKPAELMAFAGVKPGDRIAEILPGFGYFTRLLADVAGPKGVVYDIVPSEVAKGWRIDQANGLAAGHKNVVVLQESANDPATPAKLDVFWITLNYHDLHDPLLGPADLAKVNATVFRDLKPGGVYLVVDHVAQAGSGVRDTDTLHRIDPAVVKREVEAAGFRLEAESDLLSNPQDDHTKKVFDPTIRRHTDQFVFKFRKPRR